MARKLIGKNSKRSGSLRQQLLSHQKGSKENKNTDVQDLSATKKLIGKKRAHQQQQRILPPFIPFEKEDNLLLVGEGDFSFTKTIVESGMIPLENVIATSFDTEEDLRRKYTDKIEDTLSFLNGRKVFLYYNIDAQNLIKTLKLSEKDVNKTRKVLRNLDINTIMFNFPHTGSGMKDVDRNVKLHQELMVKFFQSCQLFFRLMRKFRSNEYFNKKQRIVVSLFEGEPYDSWGIKKIAKNFNYRVERSGKFNWEAFPSYHHRRTNGTLKDTSKPASQRNARIYAFEEFVKNEEDEDVRTKEDSDDE